MDIAANNKVLIVVHSATGTTRAVADALGQALNAEICVLRGNREPRGSLGVIWGSMRALRGTLVDVRYHRLDWTRFDTVILASPVWAARVSSPMRSFLAHEVAHLPERIAFVMTQIENARPDEAFADFAAICGQRPVATLHLTEADVRAGRINAKMEPFLERLAN